MMSGRCESSVTRNGRKVRMTKFAAGIHQLINKAAGGDLKAIRELLYWSRLFTETESPTQSAVSISENDRAVMENILRRIRQCEPAMESVNEVEGEEQ